MLEVVAGLGEERAAVHEREVQRLVGTEHHRLGDAVRQLVGDVVPVVHRVVEEVVADDHEPPVRQWVRPDVVEPRPVVEVHEEPEHLGRRVERREQLPPIRVVRRRLLGREPVEHRRAVAAHRREHRAVAPHALVQAAHELEDQPHVLGPGDGALDSEPAEDRATEQRREPGAPDVQQVDLVAGLAPGRRADVDEAVDPDRVEDPAVERRVAHPLHDAAEGLVLLARDEPGLALGGTQREEVPQVPRHVALHLVALRDGEVAVDAVVGELQHPGRHVGPHPGVALGPVRGLTEVALEQHLDLRGLARSPARGRTRRSRSPPSACSGRPRGPPRPGRPRRRSGRRRPA
ncbi:MAG: hypothetical protein M0P31_00140 [Solirubrobacteraceae bacterium]|nr:hypothetical protein [Solirubrobacteraceae bacterium]